MAADCIGRYRAVSFQVCPARSLTVTRRPLRLTDFSFAPSRPGLTVTLPRLTVTTGGQPAIFSGVLRLTLAPVWAVMVAVTRWRAPRHASWVSVSGEAVVK